MAAALIIVPPTSRAMCNVAHGRGSAKNDSASSNRVRDRAASTSAASMKPAPMCRSAAAAAAEASRAPRGQPLTAEKGEQETGKEGIARTGRRDGIGRLGPHRKAFLRRRERARPGPIGETEGLHTVIGQRLRSARSIAGEVVRRLTEGALVLLDVDLDQVRTGQRREPERLTRGVDGDQRPSDAARAARTSRATVSRRRAGRERAGDGDPRDRRGQHRHLFCQTLKRSPGERAAPVRGERSLHRRRGG